MEPERLTYTLSEARRVSGLGTTKLYELMGAGTIEAVKAGSRTLIMADSLAAYLRALPRATIRTGQKKAA